MLTTLSEFTRSTTFRYLFIRPFYLYLCYTVASAIWVPFGGARLPQILIEFPLYLALTWAITLGAGFNSRWQSISASVALLSTYIAFDALYLSLQRPMRFSDMQDISSLWLLGGGLRLGLILIVTVTISAVAASLWISAKHLDSRKFWRNSVLAVIISGSLLSLCYRGITTDEVRHIMHWEAFQSSRNIRYYGRLNYMLIQRGNRQENLKKIATTPIVEQENYFSVKPLIRRNIFLVLMESMLDPTAVAGAEFAESPLHPSLKQWMTTDTFDWIRSPVYGGNTAQAVFELLSGVPALHQFSSIENNNFTGNPVSGFSTYMRDIGYETNAYIASSSRYFNNARAMKGLGYSNTCFADDCGFKRAHPKDKRVHDLNVLGEVSRKFSNSTSQKPQLTYVLGMHGHLPLRRNREYRPDTVELKGALANSDFLINLSNQFYYRTEAIAQFLKQINQQDPNAVVLISSDHLPSFALHNLNSKRDKYLVPALLFMDGKRIEMDEIEMWKVPHYILQLLGGYKTTSEFTYPTKEESEAQYLNIMKEALGF